jgi:lactoylglutathione lyase
MKHFLYLIILIPFFSISQERIFKLTYDHNALPVNKLKETGDFYIKILGFKEIVVTADQSNPKRWVQNYEGKQLHLIASNENSKKLIINHSAFSTNNFQKLIDHLVKNNIAYWTYELEKNKVRIRKDGVRQVYIQDPEGNWIEINEVN